MTAVGIAALVTTVVLGASYFFRGGTQKKMSMKKAVIVGLAQGAAIVPGISRSGTTISAGMFSGLDRETAARFSFILAIPSLVGATAFVLLKSWGDFHLDPIETIVGTVTVVISGYFSIRFLLFVVKKGGLHVFALYTLVFGICFLGLGLYYGL
jgi:undecaprenyl-diphosphatase